MADSRITALLVGWFKERDWERRPPASITHNRTEQKRSLHLRTPHHPCLPAADINPELQALNRCCQHKYIPANKDPSLHTLTQCCRQKSISANTNSTLMYTYIAELRKGHQQDDAVSSVKCEYHFIELVFRQKAHNTCPTQTQMKVAMTSRSLPSVLVPSPSAIGPPPTGTTSAGPTL